LGMAQDIWARPMSEVSEQFLRALPQGEWSQVQVVEVPGMMSKRTIQADAEWEKAGGVPARLKCFLVRDESAGPESQLVVGRERLERLERRLGHAKETAPSSLVRILHVGFMDGFAGLLLAMERVTPLTELIAANKLGPSHAAQVIEQLAYDSASWVHFDICPGNTARTNAGDFVFIDPDSFYLAEGNFVEITYPALKNRLPHSFLARIRAGLGEKGLMDVALARQKHDSEVVLVAAECCLGPLEVTPLAAGHVQEWIDESQYGNRVTDPIKVALLDICGGETPDMEILASALKHAAAEPMAAAKRGSIIKEVQAAPEIKGGSWSQLDGARRALRAERLGKLELQEYRETILRLAREPGSDRVLWEEAVVIVVGYEKDPILALSVLDEALTRFPNDPDFLADRRLVLMCRGAS
jgi:hypothetical protein